MAHRHVHPHVNNMTPEVDGAQMPHGTACAACQHTKTGGGNIRSEYTRIRKHQITPNTGALKSTARQSQQVIVTVLDAHAMS